MIDSYSFGRLVIDGKEFTSDVIIFPGRVMSNWWRKEGHRLDINDLDEVLRERVKVLVVGTGYFGLMKIPTETKGFMESKGFELVIQSTREAYKTYNRLVTSGKKVAAALHLTC